MAFLTVAWFRKAADQGYSQAQVHLGNMYLYGQGVPKDIKKAVAWFRKGAQQGDASAQYNLGEMYHQGEGVVQDNIQAHKWFNIAGANGEKNAIKFRGIIEKRMSPSQIKKAKRLAREWLKKYKKKALSPWPPEPQKAPGSK